MGNIIDHKTYKLPIEEYIKALTGNDISVIHSFLNGNCYQFAVILKDIYDGDICVNTKTWHHLFLYENNYYDATGRVDFVDSVVKMSEIVHDSYGDWFLLNVCQRNKWTSNLNNNFDELINKISKETVIREEDFCDAIKIITNYMKDIKKMEKQEFNKVELDDERISLINLFEEKNKNFNKEEFIKEMNENVQKKIFLNEIDKVDLLMFIQAHSNRIERAVDDSGIIPYSFFYALKSYIDAFHNLYMKEMHNNENNNACRRKIIDSGKPIGKPMWKKNNKQK